MHLVADNLSVERGGRLVIAGLSLAVAAGEAVVLTGPNGAGKTTLLRALAGFLKPVGGCVRLEGGRADAEIIEQCHWVGHRDGVKASLSVEENATFWARYLGRGASASAPMPERPDDKRNVQDALDRVGIGALSSVPAAYLSAGQRRRLGLSRLLLARRPLWLLDEPTAALDAAGSQMLAGLMREHLAGGGLAVAATHLPLGLAGARELRLGDTPPGLGEGQA